MGLMKYNSEFDGIIDRRGRESCSTRDNSNVICFLYTGHLFDFAQVDSHVILGCSNNLTEERQASV